MKLTFRISKLKGWVLVTLELKIALKYASFGDFSVIRANKFSFCLNPFEFLVTCNLKHSKYGHLDYFQNIGSL